MSLDYQAASGINRSEKIKMTSGKLRAQLVGKSLSVPKSGREWTTTSYIPRVNSQGSINFLENDEGGEYLYI